MSTAYDTATGGILDNYADAIEGGNSYRGSGTAYKGIAGSSSLHDLAGTSIVCTSGAASKTTFVSTTIADAIAEQLVRTDTPPMFLLCASQDSGTGNTGGARKIASFTASTDTYAVAPAFAENIQTNDAFTVREGFRRLPDNVDIEDEDTGIAAGWDRAFSLHMTPGLRQGWFGNSVYQFRSQLEIRVRFLKAHRQQNAIAAALENIGLFRVILPRSDLRSSGVQELSPFEAEPEILTDDAYKIVVADRYDLTYRVEAAYV
jgi:hypothetical protein